MARYLGAFCAGLAAFLLARGCGLPVWTDWPADWSYRDAADVGVLIFAAALLLTPKERPQP